MKKTIQLIPKNVKFPEARILGKEQRELYNEVDRKTAENFGKDSLAYKTILKGINTKDVTGSQFFWNTNLGIYLPAKQKVVSLEDMEEINDLDESFFKVFYSDAPEIILRTETPSWKNNEHILKNLVKQVKKEKYEFSSENPLRISGLNLVKDKNSKNFYGLFLKIGNDTKITNDERFAYSNNGKEIPFGKKTKEIYTRENGLSRCYLGRYSVLDSFNDSLRVCSYLAFSNSDGRVVLVDAEGVALKNLEVEKVINERIIKRTQGTTKIQRNGWFSYLENSEK